MISKINKFKEFQIYLKRYANFQKYMTFYNYYKKKVSINIFFHQLEQAVMRLLTSKSNKLNKTFQPMIKS